MRGAFFLDVNRQNSGNLFFVARDNKLLLFFDKFVEFAEEAAHFSDI